MSRKNDNVWLEDLWREHAGSVRAYLRRRVAASDVDDLLSEVFVVVWRHRNQKPRNPLPWLYGIGRRVISTHYRARERRGNLETRIGRQPTPQASDSAAAMDISEALKALDPDDRELLLLNAWEGLAPREIAAVMESNSPAIRMRLSRARKRFEEILTIDDPHLEGVGK